MDNREKEQAGQSMDSIPADVMKAVPYDPDILASTGENLNKLLPVECNSQVRSHIMGLIDVFLQKEHARQSMESVPADVMKAVHYDPDILTSIKENLNKLLPGECNFQSHIMGLIHAFLQGQARQSMGSSPAHVINRDPEVPQSKVLCTESDKKQQQMVTLDTNEPNNSNDKNPPGKDTDPAGKESEPVAKMPVSGTEDSSGPSGDLAPEVPQSKDLCTESDKKQQQLVTLDTNEPNNSNDKNLPGKDTDPAGKESETVAMMTVSGTEDSSGPSGEYELVIMVFMHHCCDPSHMTNNNCFTKCQPSSDNEVHIFHCAYHDSVGLLECQENEQTVAEVHSILQSYADSQAEIPQSSVTCTQQDTEQQPMATKDAKTLNITKDDKLHGGGTKPVDEGSESEQRMTVPAMEHSTGHSGGKGCLGA